MDNLTSAQRSVAGAIAAAAGVAADELTAHQDIFELGLDSLDFWSILMDVEDDLGEEVPSAVLDRLAEIDGDVTVGRLLDVVSIWDVVASGAQL